jgi:hypothetical protein
VEVCLGFLQFEEETLVVHEAIECLGLLGEPRAIDGLLAHLRGCEERGLRLAHFAALRRITSLPFGRDEDKWVAWWTNHRHEYLNDADS